MLRRVVSVCLIGFVILSFLPILTQAAGNDKQFVKIGLAQDQDDIFLTSVECKRVIDLAGLTPVTISPWGDSFDFSCAGETVFINGIPYGRGPFLIITDDNRVNDWNGRLFRGAFLITAQNNKLTLANQLPLEDYLRGVVPKEVISEWPMASLKAQAIAARTYTLASLQRHKSMQYDLCATEHCQVYGGVLAETTKTDLAVSETADKIISYKGKIISAFYHAASGGYTSDAVNVWQNDVPYLKPVSDWDQNSPHTQWTRTFNWCDIQVMAGQSYPSIGRLKQALPVSFDRNGTILQLNLKGDLGEVTVSGEQFRYMTGIPSSKINIGVIYGPEPFVTLWWMHKDLYPEAIMANNEIPGLIADILQPPWDLPDPWAWLQDKEILKMVIRGSGWGHGVGLSQWGAKGMADAGFNETQIIEHYYPGAKVTGAGNLK